MGVGDSGVALVRAHIGQAGAQLAPPVHGFALASQGAKILGAGNLGAKFLHQRAVTGETIARQNHLASFDAGGFHAFATNQGANHLSLR